MTALYELAHDYRTAADKLADLDLPLEVIEDTLEGLSGDLEMKATNTAMLIRNIEANAAAIRPAMICWHPKHAWQVFYSSHRDRYRKSIGLRLAAC